MTMAVAWLWQGLAIAMVTALALHRLKHMSAATRHAIWWLALLAVALLPVVHLAPFGSLASSPAASEATVSGSAVVAVRGVPAWVVFAAAAIWLITFVHGVIRILSGLRVLVRLKKHSEPFEPARQSRLAMWTSVRASGRPAELRVANVPCGASALGFFQPVILISRDLAAALDDDQLDQIVIHEHAHLARWDDWSRLGQAIVAAVAGLHPAVRFINHQIHLEREAACDDRVLSRNGAPKQYAACLADAAALTLAPFDAAMSPGAIGSPRTLMARVNRVLDPARARSPRPGRIAVVGVALLFAGILAGSKGAKPLVIFVESHAPVAARAFAAPSDHNAQPGIEIERERAPSRRVLRVKSSQTTPRVDQSPMELTPRHAAGRAIEQSPEFHAVEAPPLPGSRLAVAFDAPPAPDVARRQASGSDAAWDAAATAAVAIGSGAKRSGLAVGAFFTRAGKAIADSF